MPQAKAPAPTPRFGPLRRHLPSAVLLSVLALTGTGLAVWKLGAIQRAEAAAADQPEPVEAVSVARAVPRPHQPSITAIGTVIALRSVTLRNEVAGTVHQVLLSPGEVVEPDTLLVALDVSVEEAELRAQEAQASLARVLVGRLERAVENRAASRMDLDRARAELDVAEAQIARNKAVIARKTLRAPFRARVGLSDVHPGQYLPAGTLLTTLQGVDPAVHVDFTVPQQVALTLREGDTVEVLSGSRAGAVSAKIVALDARVDPLTRNATVRAVVADARSVPSPGASVRVRVPAGVPTEAVSVPVSALRKGPSGDHVFVVVTDAEGRRRASLRRVQSGPMLGDDVLVHAGLDAGDTVAAEGSFKLRDGVRVEVAAAEGASGPSAAAVQN